jgi:dGTP triphosphohydrolase
MVRMKKTELTWDKYMDYLIETIDESKFMRRAETKPMSTPKAASESHVTSRATHSKIAANIAKRLADGLDLNGEYIYAGMLMHDAGHPFSAHEGEEIFNKFGKRKNCGFFHHNAKGVEVIRAEGIRDKAISKIPNINENPELREQLETEFDYFLDVIISHDGEATRGERNRKETQYPSMHDAVKDKLKRANSFNDYKFVAQTPEGKLAKMADVIAYLATDIQDGFRIGIIEDFDDDYLALLGEVLTTGYSTREGYITCAKNKIKEVKESKLRELKSEMKKPENEAILANANEIIKRAEQQGVNVTSMRDEELQKIDAIMEQKIQEIKDKSEGMSEEEKQFMYADIEKLKEFVGKMLSVNSSVVQEITSRMQEYFINDIVTETRAKTEEKEKTILELREKLALNPGDKELRKQLEDEEKDTPVNPKFSYKAEKLFDNIKNLNYKKIVQYTKWDYQIEQQPEAAKELVTIAAKALKETGAIRNKFYDRAIRREVESEALQYMRVKTVDESQYEKNKEKYGIRAIKRAKTPENGEKYTAKGKQASENRKHQLCREVYNNVQKEGDNFAVKFNNVFAAIPKTVEMVVDEAISYDEPFTRRVNATRNIIKAEYDGKIEKLDDPDKQERLALLLVGRGICKPNQTADTIKQAMRSYGYLERYEEEENRKNQSKLLEQYGTIEEVKKHRDEIIQERIEQARNNMEEKMAYQLAIDYISGMTDRSFNDLAIRTGYMSYDDLDTKRGTTRSSSVVDLIAKNNKENGEER